MNANERSPIGFFDAPYYLIAAFCGIATGCADVLINDLLFTALLVLASCMFLGAMRRRQPWRWVIAVVIFIPLTEWAANLLTTFRPTRANLRIHSDSVARHCGGVWRIASTHRY